jgi:V/A-type H+-transporting ATPase subunit I
MIVPMKKVTLVMRNVQARETVVRLGEVGVLHPEFVRPPQASAIERLIAQRQQVAQALGLLASRKAKPHRGILSREGSAVETAAHILAMAEERIRLQDRLKDLCREYDGIAPLGEFAPEDLQELRRHGITVRLCRCKKSDLEDVVMEAPASAVVGKTKEAVYVLAVGLEEFELPAEDLEVPDKGPGQLAAEIEGIRTALRRLEAELDNWTCVVPRLRAFLALQKERLEFLRVVSSMGEDGAVSYLHGYCPVPQVERLRQESRRNSWGMMVEEPPAEDEEVPTLIENPPWLRIVQPVFDLMGTVPGYREYDVSFWFLIFLSLFCGMLIGDGAYGLLLLLGTFTVQHTIRRIPPRLVALLYVFGSATVLWGLLTGNWFGVEGAARIPFLRFFVVPGLYSFSDNQNFMIHLCFVVGAVHLSIAHGVRLLRAIRSPRGLAELGWIAIIWSLFFLANHLVLRRPLPTMGILLLPIGVFLAASFANTQRGALKSFFVTLADLPLNVIRSFSDVVSYLRLFAVGYATLVVATSFNEMAAGLGWDSWPGAVGGALILVIGHSLNLILSSMAVLVHGVRLNMLEFSSHMEMTWSGRKFSPLKWEANGKGHILAGTDNAIEGEM